MKALVRRPNETVTQDMCVEGIDWNTGVPLTNKGWFGGAYTLVQNYVPPQDVEPAQYEEVVEPDQVIVEDEDDYVVIDGKRYSKAELRSLIE